jgi:secondary thiamine-phosphate synthase enzyme
VLGRQDQVEPFGGEREDIEPVGQRGRLARHAHVGQATRDRRRDLEVPGGLAVVAGQFGRVQAEAAELAVEQRPGLRARLAVHQPQPLPDRVVQPGDLGLGPDDQALAPGGEPHHLGAVGHLGRVAGLVHARGVDQPGRGQPQGLTAPARPPGEPQRRVEQGQRRLEQRQRRIAARHDEGGPRRRDGPDRDQVSVALLPDHQAARRAEAGPGQRVRAQRQRDERVPDGGERDPRALAADRGHRLRQHGIGRIAGTEELLDGHAERAGQGQRDAQRGIRMAGLDGGNGLPGHGGHPGELLLGQTAGLPGQPQPRAGGPRSFSHTQHLMIRVMKTQIIEVRTGGRETIRDITGECAGFARTASDGGDGLLHVFVPHATAGLALMELGAGSDEDLLATLAELLPADDHWRHAHGSRGHGRSHVMPAFVPPYATIPVIAGRLALGTWQSVALVDLNVDNPNRQVRLSFLA